MDDVPPGGQTPPPTPVNQPVNQPVNRPVDQPVDQPSGVEHTQSLPTQAAAPQQPVTPAAGKPGLRERLWGLRALIAVALASVILGGLGGAALASVGKDGDGDGRGGPGQGRFQRGGPGGFNPGQQGQRGGGFGQPGQPGQPGQAPTNP